MSALSDLDDAIDNVAALLKDLTANAKPTYSVGGQNVSWGEYFSTLSSQLKTLQENRQLLAGPFEYRTTGIT